MHIEKLSLINFKNYEQAALNFSEKINCLLGLNGSGKTNILDALHYLSMTKSAHNTIDNQNIRFSEQFFSIKGSIRHEDKLMEVVCFYKEGAKKSFKLNKKDYGKLSEHIGKIPSVLVTPYDTDIIREGSEARRRFFDSILSQIDQEYLSALIKYNLNLKQRNSALKKFSIRDKVDYELLETYDQLLIKFGDQIYLKRKAFIRDYLQDFYSTYQAIGTKREDVNIEYISQLNSGDMKESLTRYIKKDLITERTNYGVHKDDFKFLINASPIKKFGSQGQQKTFSIALKIAQFQLIKSKINVKPLLLLDDIFDKLDSKRIKKLLGLINENYFGQVFITDAGEERAKKLLQEAHIKATYFQVKNGVIQQEGE